MFSRLPEVLFCDEFDSRLTNMHLYQALQLVGENPIEGCEEAPTATSTVKINSCKTAIATDFYKHTSNVLWNLLQLVEQDINGKTHDMTSEDTLKQSQNKFVVAKCGKERVLLVAQVW